MDTVDEEQPVLAGNELEVDSVDEGPDLPRTLARREEVILDLCSDNTERVTVNKSKVGEKDGHEDGAPQNLVDCDLHGNGLCVGSGDLGVEPVVEIVTRWPMVKETKGRERNESLHVESSARNEDLVVYVQGE